MIFRALTPTGDFTFGQGRSGYLTKEAAIQANIKTSLYSYLNDAFWRMDFGIDWQNLIGGKNPQARESIILQTRTTIINCFGVTKINTVDVNFNARTRNLTISYDINTIFTTNRVNSVTI